ncbi:MAG: hypothetical protein ABSC22_05900 [Roseiarcus sp.]|jgi:hypothetical protein
MSALLLRTNLPRGPEHYWKAACDFGPNGFTARELLGCTNGVSRTTVRIWIREMVERGLLVVIERRDVKPRGQLVYAVARPTRNAPIDPEVRHGRVQRQMWTAMRNLTTFTVAELAAAASTDEVAVSRHSAADYVRRLAGVGVLTIVRQTRANNLNSGMWRLKKSANTGPLAPRQIEVAVMIDRNTGKPLGNAEARS